MNMEELKLIADTIGKLGDAGQSAFVWWLITDKVVPAFAWIACTLAILFTMYRIVVRVTHEDSTTTLGRLEQANEAVRKAWLHEVGERSTELMKMHKALEEMLRKV